MSPLRNEYGAVGANFRALGQTPHSSGIAVWHTGIPQGLLTGLCLRHDLQRRVGKGLRRSAILTRPPCLHEEP